MRFTCLLSQPVVWAARQVRLLPMALHAEPVAGGQPVNIVQNISGDLLDGGADSHHVADDAGDRAGSLNDDEQRAGGAARSAPALLAPPCGVG
eukprot:3661559-Prymnesium_polylepis.1